MSTSKIMTRVFVHLDYGSGNEPSVVEMFGYVHGCEESTDEEDHKEEQMIMKGLVP